MLSYHPTPTQEIYTPALTRAHVRLFIKREDLNHPTVSGNKWWKLKYNLLEAVSQKKETLLTYGGAFSNHIYATSSAAKLAGLKSIGIIRGEQTLPSNYVLEFARAQGMHIRYVSRSDFKSKSEETHINSLKEKFGDFYIIPEGGSNALGVKGITEFAATLDGGFEYVCSALGTGATLAGIISGMKGVSNIVGFTVLKGDGWENEIRSFNPLYHNWQLVTDYHFGGYAKITNELRAFIAQFQQQHNIPIEHVYTGKMFFGILDLIDKGFFPEGSRILAIHSGGIHSSIQS